MIDSKDARVHGWRLQGNYGNYGIYGWGFGIFRSNVVTCNRVVESDVIVQFGPWKAMWTKVSRAEAMA